jgi:hypothetical protein
MEYLLLRVIKTALCFRMSLIAILASVNGISKSASALLEDAPISALRTPAIIIVCLINASGIMMNVFRKTAKRSRVNLVH